MTLTEDNTGIHPFLLSYPTIISRFLLHVLVSFPSFISNIYIDRTFTHTFKIYTMYTLSDSVNRFHVKEYSPIPQFHSFPTLFFFFFKFKTWLAKFNQDFYFFKIGSRFLYFLNSHVWNILLLQHWKSNLADIKILKSRTSFFFTRHLYCCFMVIKYSMFLKYSLRLIIYPSGKVGKFFCFKG